MKSSFKDKYPKPFGWSEREYDEAKITMFNSSVILCHKEHAPLIYSPEHKSWRAILLQDEIGMAAKKTQDSIKKQKHYTQHKIQPMEYLGLNNIGFLEGNVIKYVSRYNIKNGIEDLKKAQHYLEKLIEREEKGTITL